MNDIAKKAASDRFLKALEAEKLSKADGGSCIDLTPAQVSYLFNEKYWGRLGNVNWDKVLMWVNSGQGLQEYSVKHGKVLAEKITNEPKAKDEPAIDVKKTEAEPIEVTGDIKDRDIFKLINEDTDNLRQAINFIGERIKTVEEYLNKQPDKPPSLNTSQKTVIDIEIRVNGKAIRLE